MNKKRNDNRLIEKKVSRGSTCNKSNDYYANKDANADGIVDARSLVQDVIAKVAYFILFRDKNE